MSDAPLADGPESQGKAGGLWSIVFHTRRVRAGWEAMERRHPENSARCLHYLATMPTERYAMRVYPLKGRQHRGVWCYEVSGGDRVYYVPDSARREVRIYYAGEHPPGAPTPP